MIPIDELFTDKLTDEVGRLVMNLRTGVPGRSRESSRRELLEVAESRGYIRFLGHYTRYHLIRLGDSCI